MAQPKPNRKFDEILNLVDQLSPEEYEELVEEMKLKWLRRAMDESEKSIQQSGTIPANEVFARLEQRYEPKKAD